MIVVSDTSPITALLKTERADLLVELFSIVIIPEAVRDELLRSHAAIPAWLQTRAIDDIEAFAKYATIVDRGEAEAIELAKELHADLLLIDERKGWRLAIQVGLPAIGLLGVVLLAKRKGLITSARDLLRRLADEAGAYLAPDLVETALKTVGE
jgi:uncharacterized protein